MTNTNNTTNNTTNTNRISKKAYASVKVAQDDMNAILTLGKVLKEGNAYATAQVMAEIAAQYMADFGNVDPAWTPASAQRKQSGFSL